MSNRVEKLKQRAREQEDSRNWVAAIKLYRKAVSAAADGGLSPSDVGIYNRIGDLYLKLDDVPEAVHHYLQAVDEYAEAEMYPPAVALCRKILRVAPNQIDAYRKLARLHAATGLMADAREEFDRYLEGLRRKGEVDDAVEGLDELAGALLNGQFDAETFRSLREDGDHEEALDLLLDTWSSADFEADVPDGPDAPAPATEDGAAEAAADETTSADAGEAAGTEPEADDGGDEGRAGDVVRDLADGAAEDPAPEGDEPPAGGPEPEGEDEQATGGAADAGPGRSVDAANADVEATDAALELAGEFGIDLSGLDGSGQGGRILKADVEAALVRGIDAGPAARSAAATEQEDEEAAEAGAGEGAEETGPGEEDGRGPDVPVPARALEPRVAPTAARQALEAYEPPLVIAPVTADDVAPLALGPRVDPAAALAALEAYEAPLVVAPVTADDVAPLALGPRVDPAAALAALEAHEPPAVVAPVRAGDVAPLAREPRVDPAAALAALEAHEPPAVVAPVRADAEAPLVLEPRVDPAAALAALEAHEPPLVVAPVTVRGPAPLALEPGVDPAAALAALEAYEAPLVVAPVTAGDVAPLALGPRVDPAAALAALEAHEPPVAVAPVAADGLTPLVREPRVDPAAARGAVEAYEPPLVLAPVTLEELAPPLGRPRVSAEQAREAVDAFEPSEEMKALADATFQLIGLGPRGPEHDSATEVSSSPAVDRDDDGRDEEAPGEDAGPDEPAAPGEGAAVADDAAPADDDGDTGGEGAREGESPPEEPVPAAWTGAREVEDGLPDFTELLDDIGWLGGGSEEAERDGGSRNGRRSFDVRVPGDGNGDGKGASVPDDPKLKKTLAPWAVEPRDALLDEDEDRAGTESLDFTELLKEVGWLKGREDA